MPRRLSDDEIANACALLSDQAASLVTGLRSLDPSEQERALCAHDASHESWMRLLAALDDTGAEELTGDLTALYAFHGRLAASLERGLDGWFSIAAAREVRTVLGDQLAACTTTTVARLRGLAALPAGGGDGLMAGAAA